MKWLQWAGLPVGIAILIALIVRGGAADVMHVIGAAGPALLWLVAFHALPLVLDAHAWRLLLDRRVSLAFLWWAATVREAVSRLLPVAGIGGEIVGIRLARWKHDDASVVSASVIVEVLVTIAVQYAFSALGLVLIVAATGESGVLRTVGLALLLSLPVPVVLAVLLRRGGLFHAIERWAARLLGASHPLLQGIDGGRLDADIDALMSRTGLLLRAFLWQLGGYMAGAFETWWALQLLGHPVSVGGALAIEALTQAVRHAAFMVPAGLGVQEAAVVLLAQLFGVDHQVALSLALVKRMREVIFGCLALLSWQTVELARGRRYLPRAARDGYDTGDDGVDGGTRRRAPAKPKVSAKPSGVPSVAKSAPASRPPDTHDRVH
ncbi:putative membrane protein [Paraburkholderia caballeronis]|nr:lysylphosphatidylglycerol synthase domain-containing protein [Paraburkholderia caballeronis]TDV01647.1 putative membrane protein [Paraburkholderia caballeronis]TDV06164.1 putative membrane protein [Paraburkholderia caballeronis]TDV16072.1 putative membrane protein [Paraburkholderia caballeronis]